METAPRCYGNDRRSAQPIQRWRLGSWGLWAATTSDSCLRKPSSFWARRRPPAGSASGERPRVRKRRTPRSSRLRRRGSGGEAAPSWVKPGGSSNRGEGRTSCVGRAECAPHRGCYPKLTAFLFSAPGPCWVESRRRRSGLTRRFRFIGRMISLWLVWGLESPWTTADFTFFPTSA